ncbi:MAG: hypothetical protein RR573_04735 [Oscillospiraceae bacterium]
MRDEVINGLIGECGGNADLWQHAKAIGTLNCNGEHLKAEIHWFQEKTVVKVKFKVKKWID